MRKIASDLGEVLLAHRIGAIDAAETAAILESLMDADRLHNGYQQLRHARVKDELTRRPLRLTPAMA